MLDETTIEECKKNNEVLELKIRNTEYAIEQSEEMIAQSHLNKESLSFLRKKVAASKQDLEILYLIKLKQESEN